MCPGFDSICGLSLLLVSYSAPRGFSPGTPVFPSPQKPIFCWMFIEWLSPGFTDSFLTRVPLDSSNYAEWATLAEKGFLLTYCTLTRDIKIMKRTTKLLKPSKVSPTKSMLQNELSSQAWSWELRKFTKYRNSAHEGSSMPQFLLENKQIIKSLPGL